MTSTAAPLHEQNDMVGGTDVLNLHTYDGYDWFLLLIALCAFGVACLGLGCLWNRAIMRARYIHVTEVHDTQRIGTVLSSEVTQPAATSPSADLLSSPLTPRRRESRNSRKRDRGQTATQTAQSIEICVDMDNYTD